jgi:Flp pilus assembly pilin Flp
MQRALKRFAKSQDGAVAIEMAIIAPVLLILLIFTVNIAAKFVEQARLNQVTREVVEAVLYTSVIEDLEGSLKESTDKLGKPLTGAPEYQRYICACPADKDSVSTKSCVGYPGYSDFDSRCKASEPNEVWFELAASVVFQPIVPVATFGFKEETLVSSRIIQAR